MMINEARFKKKKILTTRIWVECDKIGSWTRFFYHFLMFGSLVFIEIAYSDSFR